MLDSVAVDAQTQNVLLLAGSAVLVLLMTPAVVLFYGRWRAFLPTFGPMLLAAVLWIVYGYGLTFGSPWVRGFLGNPLALPAPSPHQLAFAAYHGAVAVFAVALITSAVAARVRTGGWMLFAALWATLVYFPVAHTVFDVTDGYVFNDLIVNDQAGGTVVMVSGGAAVLAVLLVLHRRGQRWVATPRRATTTIAAALLLWIGWLGLNLGSESVVDDLLPLQLQNTLVAPVAGIVAWVVVERIRSRRSTWRGAASGAIAGLVAVTPACNILTPAWTILLGLLAGALCALAVGLGARFGFGDSFDVVGIHLTGGILGMLYIGLFGSGIGWRDNGQPDRLVAQAVATLGIAAYSFVVALLLAWVIDRLVGLRARLE
jgi:Amt family ammonium transporter